MIPYITKQMKFPVFILMSVVLASCSEPESVEREAVESGLRWYTQSQSDTGREVFARNCASCHGDQAQGLTEDWRRRLDDGSLPAPPLNGSAHAWHHPRSVLLGVINNGGAAFGGNMPGFETVLSEEKKLAAIAFFQSQWSDEIYLQWEDIDGGN